MAQILLNPLAEGFRKRFGGIVFVKYGDDTFFRYYTPPHNPRTDAQQARRGLFADAVRSWQALGNDEKARWNRLARKAGRVRSHGYHLFIRSVLYGETAAAVQGTASFHQKSSSYASPGKLRCCSVATPSELLCTLYDTSFPLKGPRVHAVRRPPGD